ncbi:hypothetical protein V4E86_15790 [Burkholderia pseudomallei]|uniref:Uncharacterized protein n=2 Tax=Burkholderia mallei TaxID=13373 RepID=A0AAX1X4D8_BURML|nr:MULTISPECIES: hypothetical protein [pseudomallei group]EDP89173.1 conserved hypothetical protein [Burkholderia mallei ATCC 10399]EEP84354.1 conserved hypothetical protein [Burkholderia mallei GB8 horse 4]EES47296.1 conserved hypothetical protein [Burkholderia mallei PRL-20]AYE27710.1 hypothetical protein CNX72_10235 [Burkholderia pseudomallei]KOT23450.1 hypothetical protein DM52_2875 [Burkholderia mallei]
MGGCRCVHGRDCNGSRPPFGKRGVFPGARSRSRAPLPPVARRASACRRGRAHVRAMHARLAKPPSRRRLALSRNRQNRRNRPPPRPEQRARQRSRTACPKRLRHGVFSLADTFRRPPCERLRSTAAARKLARRSFSRSILSFQRRFAIMQTATRAAARFAAYRTTCSPPTGSVQ